MSDRMGDDGLTTVMKAAFDAAAVGTIVVHRSGTIELANDYANEVFGYDDLTGMSVSKLVPVHVAHEPLVERFFLTPARRVMGMDRRVEGVRADGSTIHLEVGLSPAGRDRVVVTVVDITARRAAEDAQRKLEEELVASRRMDALARLACGVAHDFNNTMMAIQASVASLQELVGNAPSVAEEAAYLHDAVERGARLTRQLLAFGGSQYLDPRAIDLSAVVAKLADMVGRACGPKVAVELDLQPALVVYIDEGQLEQVVMNLVLNARDAMPNGGKLVIATIAHEASKMAVLTVADSGPGIPPEHLGHVFDPFFTTKGGEGTGLGLAAVRGIVLQSRGTVEATSGPGGTSFTVRLPLHSTEAEAAPISVAPRPRARPRDGTELLLVDDDRDVRRGLARVLQRAGYRVHSAESAEEALALALDDIAAVVTDLVLPGKDGGALAEALRVKRPDLPVVFISGYARDIADSLPRTGRSAFMQKPFNPPELLSVLETLVS